MDALIDLPSDYPSPELSQHSSTELRSQPQGSADSDMPRPNPYRRSAFTSALRREAEFGPEFLQKYVTHLKVANQNRDPDRRYFVQSSRPEKGLWQRPENTDAPSESLAESDTEDDLPIEFTDMANEPIYRHWFNQIKEQCQRHGCGQQLKLLLLLESMHTKASKMRADLQMELKAERLSRQQMEAEMAPQPRVSMEETQDVPANFCEKQLVLEKRGLPTWIFQYLLGDFRLNSVDRITWPLKPIDTFRSLLQSSEPSSESVSGILYILVGEHVQTQGLLYPLKLTDRTPPFMRGGELALPDHLQQFQLPVSEFHKNGSFWRFPREDCSEEIRLLELDRRHLTLFDELLLDKDESLGEQESEECRHFRSVQTLMIHRSSYVLNGQREGNMNAFERSKTVELDQMDAIFEQWGKRLRSLPNLRAVSICRSATLGDKLQQGILGGNWETDLNKTNVRVGNDTDGWSVMPYGQAREVVNRLDRKVTQTLALMLRNRDPAR